MQSLSYVDTPWHHRQALGGYPLKDGTVEVLVEAFRGCDRLALGVVGDIVTVRNLLETLGCPLTLFDSPCFPDTSQLRHI